jgi:hypothetical protein
MKRMLSVVLTGAVALAALVAIQGCGVLGGPPTGVAVSAGPDESDSTVVISWTVPAEGGPDKYVVYFRALTDSGYVVIGETTATSYAHNPHGMTGQYKVAALFGQEAYEGADKPTTVPIQNDAAMLFEINADSSRCGYGWDRDSGVGGVFGMIDAADSAYVDFYVSDRSAGSGDSLHVVSPNKADSTDPGAFGIVPEAGWRANGFSNPLLDGQNPLPAYDTAPYTYFIFTRVTMLPCYVACYTAGETEKHYSLIQVDSIDAPAGRMWMKSWYQLVPGLRLIRH